MRCKRASQPRSRSGLTLIEIMVTTSVLMMLAISASQILQSVSRTGIDVRDAAQNQRGILRLANQLRRDVEGSLDIEIDQAAAKFNIQADRLKIEYRWISDQQSWIRTTMEPANEALTDQVALDRESFESFNVGKLPAPKINLDAERLTLILKNDTPRLVLEASR